LSSLNGCRTARLPMRTNVAALGDWRISKSPLIPIDQCIQLESPGVEIGPARPFRRARNTRRSAAAISRRRRHAHQGRAARKSGQRLDGTPASSARGLRRHAPLGRLGVTNATWMHTLSGGAWKGRCSESRRAILERSTLCTQWKAVRQIGAGPCWIGCRRLKCHCRLRSAELIHLGQRFLQIVFRRNP